jgi:hypothetical protein
VHDGGPADASGVSVSDPLPSGVSLVTATPSQGGCTGTSTITCALGSLLNGATATVTISVVPGHTGTLSNTATVSASNSDPNAGNNSATATTTVSPVNHPPVAVADSYTAPVDTSLAVEAPGVLANDTDVDQDTLSATLVSGPGSGTVQLNADGSFNYLPNPSFHGSDSFTYRATDPSGAGSNVASVSINVTAKPLASGCSTAATCYFVYSKSGTGLKCGKPSKSDVTATFSGTANLSEQYEWRFSFYTRAKDGTLTFLRSFPSSGFYGPISVSSGQSMTESQIYASTGANTVLFTVKPFDESTTFQRWASC